MLVIISVPDDHLATVSGHHPSNCAVYKVKYVCFLVSLVISDVNSSDDAIPSNWWHLDRSSGTMSYIINDLRPQRPLSLTWMSNHMLSKVWGEITYPFPNFNGCTVEVWEWLSNFMPHFIKDVITYPCSDLRWSMLVKGAPGIVDIN